MTMLSYAPNAEDVVLARAFAGRADGFWIDLDAPPPDAPSVTRHFAALGWRGIDVTGDPDRHVRLAGAGATAVLARIGAAADGDAGGDADADADAVPTQTLAAIVAAHATDITIDLLRIDGDAAPAAVIAATDWRAVRPRVLLVAAVDGAGAPSHFGWHRRLNQAGLRLCLFDGINRFYAREEEGEAFQARLAAPAHARDGWRRAVEAERIAGLESALAGLEAEAGALRTALQRAEAERDVARLEIAALLEAQAARAAAPDAAPGVAASPADSESGGGGRTGRLLGGLLGRRPGSSR